MRRNELKNKLLNIKEPELAGFEIKLFLISSFFKNKLKTMASGKDQIQYKPVRSLLIFQKDLRQLLIEHFKQRKGPFRIFFFF